MARRVDILPQALLLWALMLLVLPLRWLLGAVAAAMVHELWHLLAIRLSGGMVRGIRIGAGGVKMDVDFMPPRRELLCALAGPLGSFSLLLAAKWLPVTALCGFIQGVFNLLPVFPMDGGRVLRSAVLVLVPSGAEEILKILEPVVGVLLLILGLCAVVKLGLGWMWGLFLLAAAVRTVSLEKYLAKKGNKGYNRDRLN